MKTYDLLKLKWGSITNPHMVRGFLGGENHFLQFSLMRSDEAKKYFKNIYFLKVASNLFHHISRLMSQ